jgi:hypothetical protein
LETLSQPSRSAMSLGSSSGCPSLLCRMLAKGQPWSTTPTWTTVVTLATSNHSPTLSSARFNIFQLNCETLKKTFLHRYTIDKCIDIENLPFLISPLKKGFATFFQNFPFLISPQKKRVGNIFLKFQGGKWVPRTAQCLQDAAEPRFVC